MHTRSYRCYAPTLLFNLTDHGVEDGIGCAFKASPDEPFLSGLLEAYYE